MENKSKPEIVRIDRWQKGRQKLFKSVPSDGKMIKYLGKEFKVYPNTFWPFTDSKPLVKNFRVQSGESVLDVGTGSGVIAIFSCYQGAGKVVGVDINPAAIKSAKHNLKMHGFEKVMKVVKSDLFENIADQKFDVITANIPFRDKFAHDVVARAQWDTDFQTNTRFFAEVVNHLNPGGRIYFIHSNFGETDRIKKLAKAAGLSVKAIGREAADKSETKVFHAFVMRRIAEDN
ncbi:release factor glutamine methyltransferase [Rhodoferax sp. OV413]|uniref:methyltransferase n=1 Tax=Rhodoferax sp. OV413 TaxID=1855285 RepID=UPI00087F101A|nr:methyltransferase [Rhodoferax sp. OV413]SDP55190.1 release factor glutamine methyltransferase [Rhodoferax sp. OV413]